MKVVPTAAPVTNCPAARACQSERTGTPASPSAAVIRSEPVIHGSGKFSSVADIAADEPDREGREQDRGGDGDVGEARRAAPPAATVAMGRWLWPEFRRGKAGTLLVGLLRAALSSTLASGTSAPARWLPCLRRTNGRNRNRNDHAHEVLTLVVAGPSRQAILASITRLTREDPDRLGQHARDDIDALVPAYGRRCGATTNTTS